MEAVELFYPLSPLVPHHRQYMREPRGEDAKATRVWQGRYISQAVFASMRTMVPLEASTSPAGVDAK